MIRFVVFVIGFEACLSQPYHGSYSTISSNLRSMFSNDYNLYTSSWSTSTDYSSSGMPSYAITCKGTPRGATEQTHTLKISTTKTLDATSYCTPLGAIGYSLTGVPLYNAASADLKDAFTAEGETFDGCGGHADPTGAYHYHIIPGSTCPSKAGSDLCFPWQTVTEFSSELGTTYMVGVALDGFPIFVTTKDGNVILESNIDECGGKAYTYNSVSYYAYFLRPTFPYTLGCYKGTIVESSNRAASSVGSCGNSMVAGSICYCDMAQGATVASCLPASGQTSCTAGQTTDCNISGTCLSVLPSDTSSATSHHIGCLFAVTIFGLIKLIL